MVPKLTASQLESKIKSQTQELKLKYLEQGPLVYELYAIMLHSGGAYGGHYSAYIKDFEGDQDWFHFNDSFVKKIAVTDVVEAFGQVQTSSARKIEVNVRNAYMLHYRLVENPSVEVNFSLNDIAHEVQEEIHSMS